MRGGPGADQDKMKIMRKLPFLGWVCLAGAAFATMVPRFTLEQMVERSERIVHGRCLRSWSAWDSSHQFIWTHYEIQVAEPLKGAPAATIFVSEPGGQADGLEMAIAGVPRYQPGEEVVAFLYRTPIGYWRAYGLGQGKYLVRDGRVRADLHGASLVEADRSALDGGADLRRLDGIALQEFKSRVRGLAARQSRGAK